MTPRQKTVQASLIEQPCSKCCDGVYRVVDRPALPTNPKQFLHHCHRCHDSVYFTMAYPIVEYREKWFMLADALRFECKDAPRFYAGRDQ